MYKFDFTQNFEENNFKINKYDKNNTKKIYKNYFLHFKHSLLIYEEKF